MPRLRLQDVKNSRLPELVGLCRDDTAGIARMVNSAQRRLLLCREAGDEGWWGTWAEVAFTTLSRNAPYITCPREIARIERIDICRHPVKVHNQFYEYLNFGNGRMPQLWSNNNCISQAYTRNNVPTFWDLTGPPKIIRVYATNPYDMDAGRTVFIGGQDSTGTDIYLQYGYTLVKGAYVTLTTPFVDFSVQYNSITGIQKDSTLGEVQIFQVDPVTGEESALLFMQPGEQVSGYRRYYLNALPANCCSYCGPVSNVPVTAIVKLELIPVGTDTDYLLLQNLEALTEECQSIRLSEVDTESAKKMAAERHQQAVRLLQGELVHYLGKTDAAVNFAPFGSARLERQKIGTMI